MSSVNPDYNWVAWGLRMTNFANNPCVAKNLKNTFKDINYTKELYVLALGLLVQIWPT